MKKKGLDIMSIKKLISILSVLIFSVQLAAAANVSISDFSFQPGTINITSGNTVTWTNLDTTQHTVTADTGSFGSGNLSSGNIYSFTFNTLGNFNYHCTIHTSMTGTVVVSGQISPATINVTPLTITLTPGSTKTFTAKGFDWDNKEIPISREVSWTVSNMAVGSIIPINTTSSMFTTLSAGTTTISAVLDNLNANATVIVTAGLSSEVALWDANNDFVIQKSEAITAVLAYFATPPAISKADAIKVVLAYFG